MRKLTEALQKSQPEIEQSNEATQTDDELETSKKAEIPLIQTFFPKKTEIPVQTQKTTQTQVT